MIEPSPSISGLSAALSAPRAAPSGPDFSGVLSRATDSERRETARQLASQLVSSAFIMPVLESIRESPFQEAPFAPNFAERRFAPMLDEQIADRIARASNFPLVDAIVDRLLGPQAELTQGASP